jgi:hypothetical protein
MVKVAIYSCNFGNYRKELKNYLSLKCDDNIDYFLFTDNKELKLNKWNIIYTKILPGDEIMDGNRWTSKYIKFVLPDILKSYDIIIWIDSKTINKPNIMTYDKVLNLLEKYPTTDVFNLKHPDRKTIQEELATTIKLKVENKIPGQKFLKQIKNFKSSFSLPDTTLIIRKNNKKINDIFEYCFELMKKYKLKRDQNIYNYAFDNKGVIPLVLSN